MTEEAANRELVKATKARIEVMDSPQEAVYEAQALYMRYAPIAKIAIVTGIDVGTLQGYIYGPGNWKDQRAALHKEINEELKHNALKQLKRIGATTLDLVESSVVQFQKACQEIGIAPSLEQAFMLTQMYGLIHKAKVTEEGSDDGKSSLALAPDDVVRALSNDPYLSHVFDAQKEISASEKVSDEEMS